MNIRYKNGEEYYHKLYTFFNATLAVTILPLALLVLQKQSDQLFSIFSEDWMLYSMIIGLFISMAIVIYWSINVHTHSLHKIKENQDLRHRLNLYYSACIKMYLSFMLAAGICVSGLFVTANSLFIVGYVVCMIILSLRRPTLTYIIEQLSLNELEKDILYEKKTID